jgi:hypothetical protein
MKLNYDISWILIRIPILPWLKITKIEPTIKIRKVMVKVPVPTPEPVEEPKQIGRGRPRGVATSDYPYRTYDLDKGHFRQSGPLAGTEKYRLHHAREALIKFFVDTDNKPLRVQDIRKHPNSPFWHNYIKCNPNCTDQIISEGSLHAVLRNEKYQTEDLKEMFGTTEIFICIKLPTSNTANGYRLSDEAYFNQLNIITRNDFVTRTLAKEVTVTTETKKPKYGYQREAIDRMT